MPFAETGTAKPGFPKSFGGTRERRQGLSAEVFRVTVLPHPSQLPFSVIGSLNGVHMFGQNLDVQLDSARTEDTTVVWKSFHDRSLGGWGQGNERLHLLSGPGLDDPL